MKRKIYAIALMCMTSVASFAQSDSFTDLLRAPAEVTPATEDDVICTLYSSNEDVLQEASEMLKSGISTGDNKKTNDVVIRLIR